jgi:signal transduction histidine kinase
MKSQTHDLRSRMNVIIGFTDLLHAGMIGPVNPDQKQMLAQILETAQRVYQTVEHILARDLLRSARTT